EVAEAYFGRCADTDVIEQFDLEELGGFSQPARQAVVRLARRRVAGWMIVHDNYGMRRVSERWTKNFPWMRDALVEAAERNRLDALQPVTRVEQDDTQRLSLQHSHFVAQ